VKTDKADSERDGGGFN